MGEVLKKIEVILLTFAIMLTFTKTAVIGINKK